ncbi:MAG: hypothetical protein LUE29_02900 [Lachnospiraceae bacterium]|nr:hypothetical protein [Lachnospiraceae bacterium]
MQYRKRIYEIVELSGEGKRASTIYDYFMMAVIIISLVPLAFKETNVVFEIIDWTAAIIDRRIPASENIPTDSYISRFPGRQDVPVFEKHGKSLQTS